MPLPHAPERQECRLILSDLVGQGESPHPFLQTWRDREKAWQTWWDTQVSHKEVIGSSQPITEEMQGREVQLEQG